MKIFIHRGGSGWGGVTGDYLIDTCAKTKLDCDKCFRDHHYECGHKCRECSKSKPTNAISEFNHDLSLLEAFLPTCELVHLGYCMMDQQIDKVHIQCSRGNWRKVWDTDDVTYPTNEALCAKLRKLIEFVSGGILIIGGI